MRKIMMQILIVIIGLSVLSAEETPGIGTDIRQLQEKMLSSGEVGSPLAVKIPDGWPGVSLFFQKTNFGYDFITARVDGHIAYPYGFSILKGGKTLYFYDSDYNGSADTVSENLVPPFWIYFLYDDTNRQPNPEFIAYLDRLYEIVKGKVDPQNNPESKVLKESLESKKSEASLKSIDMFYVFWHLQKYGSEFPFLSYSLIGLLDSGLQKRFGKPHPLILLYRLELQIQMAYVLNARDSVKALLALDPDCVPAKVYDIKIGKYDSDAKKKMIGELEKKYPGHWMLKKINNGDKK